MSKGTFDIKKGMNIIIRKDCGWLDPVWFKEREV